MAPLPSRARCRRVLATLATRGVILALFAASPAYAGAGAPTGPADRPPVAVAPAADVLAVDPVVAKTSPPVSAAPTAAVAPVAAPPATRTTAPGPCDGDIDFAEVISCDFGSPSTVRELDFDASANDQIRVRVVVTGGAVNPIASVLRSGAVVCGATFSDEFTCKVTVSGTQTLKIDANGSGTGTVSTTIQRLNNPTACKALPYGTDGKTASITKAAQLDCWTHDAANGEKWRIRLVETGGAGSLLHEVVRPDGTTVCGLNGNTESTCTLDATGPFRVLVEVSGGLSTADYRVVIERFPGATGCDAADFNKARTMKVTAAGAFSCVTFAGAAGNQIRVRAVLDGGAWNPTTDVVAADGSTVCGATFSDEFTCTLNSAGTHTIFVRDGAGTGASLGEARLFLQRLDDPVGCKKLKSGTSGTTASISTGAEIDCYRLGAKAGDRWRIRVVETGGTASLLHEVVRPNGTTVCGLNGNTDSTCLLDANGESRVLVQDSSGTATGDYRIVLEKFPKPKGCSALDYGASDSVAVTKAGALDCFTISGKAGDQVRVRVVLSGGSWNPTADVVAADGSTVCGATFSDQFTCTLTSAGSHVVFVRDGAGTGASTGTAAVFVQRLNNPLGCKTLKSGTDGLTGAISPAVEIDCFSQKAKAGDQWRIRVVETGGGSPNLLHEVVRPDGTTVCGLNGNTDSTCALDASGEHRILVEDAAGTATGDYRIVLEKFPKPKGCTAIEFGAAASVEVSKAGAVDCVTFSGKAGDQIRVRAVSTGGAWNPTTDVVRADGSTVCGATFSDEFTCQLTSAGQHALFFREGAGTGAGLGTADIFVQRLNDPEGCSSIAYGTDGKTASITDAVEIDCFLHDATAGQRWRIRVVETGGTTNLLHEVVRPDGTVVCGLNGNTESTCLFDTNGEHRILVQDSAGTATGTYRVVVEKFPGPTDCASLTVGGATLTGGVALAGGFSCATFTGQAGDTIHFKAVSTGGGWNPTTEILRTDGTTVCGATFSDEFDCALTTNGTHTVLIRDGAGTGADLGTYTLEADKE